MPEARKQQLLKEARDVLGTKALCDGLKVSAEQLEDWIDGRAVMPDRRLSDLSALLIEFARTK